MISIYDNDQGSGKLGTNESWLDESSLEVDEVEVEEFDIVSSPNDWNFTTIVNFIESGALKIPDFQRNYVWDRKRASKLIESLLIGLPVPQVFLYEEGRNDFLVIDGQQRLLTLYFFAKGRFPRSSIRGELRPILSSGALGESVLNNDEMFEPFKLSLSKRPDGSANRFNGLSYHGLRDDRTTLDLRTIRNMVVKQVSPEGDSAVFEIFSRLNTGGVNLTPQEIRASLYHSDLFNRILQLNLSTSWRHLTGQASPDSRMRDIEFLLRGLALAKNVDKFSGSMANFINAFCLEARRFTPEQTENAEESIRSFIEQFDGHPGTFLRGAGGKFSGVLFEAFYAAWSRLGRPAVPVDAFVSAIEDTKLSEGFAHTLQEGSTKPTWIRTRISLAEEAIRAIS